MPRALALVHCGQDGAEGVRSAEHIGDEDTVVVRLRPAFLVGQVRDVVASRRVDDRRIGRQAHRRAALTVAGDGAVDQRGLDADELGIVQAEPLHHAGPEVLDEHVGGTRSRLTMSTAAACLRSRTTLFLPALSYPK
jgi:hypothetical protein